MIESGCRINLGVGEDVENNLRNWLLSLIVRFLGLRQVSRLKIRFRFRTGFRFKNLDSSDVQV